MLGRRCGWRSGAGVDVHVDVAHDADADVGGNVDDGYGSLEGDNADVTYDDVYGVLDDDVDAAVVAAPTHHADARARFL